MAPPSDSPVSTLPAPPARLRLKDLRRLPGRQSMLLVFTAHRLWIGPDYLLQRRRTPFTEELRRYAFRDVQALEICGTSRATVYNFVLGGLLLIVGASAALIPGTGAHRGLAVLGGILVALLMVNLVRGPTCRFALQTALGSQTLPTLGRRRAARRALELLVPRIEAAQAPS